MINGQTIAVLMSKGPVTPPPRNEKRETRNEKRETRNRTERSHRHRETRNEKRETRNEKRETRNEKRETRNEKRETRNEKREIGRSGHTATEKRETRNEKTVAQSKLSSSPILFLGTRKLDDFQDRQPTDFLPPRKILTNQREVQ